ncbi:hypothetical protein LTR17_001285 [Elasticomyces elasticus]|nr:hypothetical protein LTR17_001285 [Elasticomyces elasticus]
MSMVDSESKSSIMSDLQTHLDIEVPVAEGLAGYYPEQSMPLAAIITILLFVISSIALGLLIVPRINKSICIIAETTINRIIDARITRKTQNIVVKQAILQSSLDARINALVHGYHQATQAAEQDRIRKIIRDYVTSALRQDRADRKVGLDTCINKAYDTRHAAEQEQLHQAIDSRVTNALETAGLTNQEGLRCLIDARIRETHRVRKTSEQEQLQQIIDARILRAIEVEQAAQHNSIRVLIDTSVREYREAQSFIQQETIGKLVDERIRAAIEADRAAQRGTPQKPVTSRIDRLHEVQESTRQHAVLHVTGAQVDSMSGGGDPRNPIASRIAQTSKELQTTTSNPVTAVVKVPVKRATPVVIDQQAGVGFMDRKHREQMQQWAPLYLNLARALEDINMHIPDDYSSGVILTSTYRISQVINSAITALEAIRINKPGSGEIARGAMHDYLKSITGYLAGHNYGVCCGVLDTMNELREHICVALQGGIDNDGPGVQTDMLQLLREGSQI